MSHTYSNATMICNEKTKYSPNEKQIGTQEKTKSRYETAGAARGGSFNILAAQNRNNTMTAHLVHERREPQTGVAKKGRKYKTR
jgi:predicted DsbA family dithiol-disulfide isomerase